MFRKQPALWLAILLSVIFIVAAFLRVGFLESLELAAYDWRMGLRSEGPEAKTDIALVDIDDDSISRLGRWPWPRTTIADMIDKVRKDGANLIGLNVIFSEAEKGEGLKLIEDLTAAFALQAADSEAAKTLLAQLETARSKLDTDGRLKQAVGEAKKIVLPVFFDLGPFPKEDPNLPEVIKKNAVGKARGSYLESMHAARRVTAPVEAFSESSGGLGHANVLPDADGAVRREILLVNYKGSAFPSYALRLALLARGIEPASLNLADVDEGGPGIKLGGRIVPVNRNYELYVTFTDTRAFPRFSFYDVLNNKVDASALKGKIVLIGVSASGVDTPLATPTDNRMSSTLRAANVLHNLLNGGFIVRSDLMDMIEIAVLVLVGAFLALALPRLKARNGALASAGLLAVIVAAGVYLFIGPGIWLKISYPVLLTVLGYAAVTTSRFLTTESVKEKVEGESAETNRMLGLSFQSQGHLDMAFDKFRRVPMDNGLKDILYNLGLDYERKRMFNKAVSVYQYIQEYDEKFKDIEQKIKKLTVASETMIFGLGSGGARGEDGVLTIDENTKPTLGRYEVTKELGRGAMGVVYLGRDPKINRVTAIKTIRFGEEYDPEEADKMKEQFFHEAETAGMLSHPNIVTIYDAGEDHDLSYIAMEYLEGQDLKGFATAKNLLPLRDVIRIVADVAEALGYAHEKGVVHRDIKPANIMLLKNGTPKVTDFGIARAVASSRTKTGVVKGTPFYMSPEQITGKKVDGRTDIYSLGVVLYELLTGVQPYQAEDLTTLIFQITSADPVPVIAVNPSVPKAIMQILDKAMAKDRDKRYQKAEQMAEHLRFVARKMDEIAAQRKAAGKQAAKAAPAAKTAPSAKPGK